MDRKHETSICDACGDDNIQGDFWASSVEIQVFPSPTGYMLTPFGSFLLEYYKYIYDFLSNDG